MIASSLVNGAYLPDKKIPPIVDRPILQTGFAPHRLMGITSSRLATLALGDLAMLSTALLLAASMVGQAEASTTGFPLLKEWAEAFTGDFSCVTTTALAIDGVCEKGESYEACSSTEWIQENVALVKKTTHKVKGKVIAIGVELIGWDAVKSAIVTSEVDSLGSRLNGVITKKGDQWIARGQGTLGDGRKLQVTSTVTIEDGGKTYKYRSSGRVGEEELPEDSGKFTRVTK